MGDKEAEIWHLNTRDAKSKCQGQARDRIKTGATDPSWHGGRRNRVGVSKGELQGSCHVLHGIPRAYQLGPWSALLMGRGMAKGSQTRDVTTFPSFILTLPSPTEHLFSYFRWTQRCSVGGKIEASKAQIIQFWKWKGLPYRIPVVGDRVTSVDFITIYVRFSFFFYSKNKTILSYSFQEPCEVA